ncbi:hypothetical protein P5673_029311 [Acropora cervicornis]|uniref:Uncharacterized protein n=1 Tax=Acropora cervicornis TaxID=6130 RepID=A0AAD9PWD8_ACRCE|nr:hypothetical protein P5673_029311 [Acropora cervicornis]
MDVLLPFDRKERMGGGLNLPDYIANLCEKTFSSIANDPADRLYSMLPFSGPSRYNLRLKKRFVIPKCGTERLKNGFLQLRLFAFLQLENLRFKVPHVQDNTRKVFGFISGEFNSRGLSSALKNSLVSPMNTEILECQEVQVASKQLRRLGHAARTPTRVQHSERTKIVRGQSPVVHLGLNGSVPMSHHQSQETACALSKGSPTSTGPSPALRGRQDDDPSNKNLQGNLQTLLTFRFDCGDHTLQGHLNTAPKTARYISKTTQNEMVTVGKYVSNNLSYKVRQGLKIRSKIDDNR